LTKDAVTDGVLNIPSDVYFIAPVRYDNLNIMLTAKLGTGVKTPHYTVGTGGQFATLTACLRALKGNNKEKVIDVFGGTYDIYEEMGGANFIATLNGTEKWQDVCDIIPDNTTIMGHGNVIIKMELPSSTPNAVATLLSPLNMMGSAKLKNLTVKAANCRYCIHPEGEKLAQYNNAVWEIEDCYIEKTDVTLGTGNAVAFGLNDGVFFKIKNCIIKSVGDSCVSMHDNGINYAVSPRVVIENCAIDAKYYPIVFSCTQRDGMQTVIKVLVANCYAPKYMRKRTSNTSAKDCYEVTYLNTPHKTQHDEKVTEQIADIEYSNFT
jgi:pectin methylesterase-like acyl-CoA thioesterase